MKSLVGPGLVACSIAMSCTGSESPNTTANEVLTVTVGDVTLANAYAPQPVTPDVGSLYFTLQNDGDAADTLVAVRVDGIGDASLHDQDRSGGSMRMMAVERIVVAPHQTVALEPGGFHVMLKQMTRHHRVGDSLAVSLTFTGIGELSFSAPVIPYADVIERSSSSHDNH